MLLQLSTFFTAILYSCAFNVLTGDPARDCGQHFTSIYQQSDDINQIPKDGEPFQDQAWAFEDVYDQFETKRQVQAKESRFIVGIQRNQLAVIVEGEINKQINKELFSHYSFLSVAFHFYRDDVHLPGLREYFKAAGDESMKHAHKLMEHLLKRGGRLKLNPIMIPCHHHWGRGLQAMEDALTLQKELLQSLRRLHASADERNDFQTRDFIEANFLRAQTDRVKQLSDYVSTLRRLGRDPLGEYYFDKMGLEGIVLQWGAEMKK
ncbi:soma ferritin-like [Stylophora pistillata]|uniref:soma ferritin-like n=1 Tax=Stylophora pistillata TaxID=50429 RepID=UPI000C051510|nr:soma ferritin-like [Stylophora pistillata]XP_022790257.1 soma ferritin-like [Stylophora pistillata]